MTDWKFSFMDLGMRTANLVVYKGNAGHMGVLRGLMGDAVSDPECMERGVQGILRAYNPELAGGSLVHVRRLETGVIEFAYMHPSLAPVKLPDQTPTIPLMPPDPVMLDRAVKLVRGVVDCLDLRPMVQSVYPRGTRDVGCHVMTTEGKVAVRVSIQAQVPCGPGDDNAVPRGEGFEQARQVDFRVELWEVALPEAEFAELLHKRVRHMVSVGAAMPARAPRAYPWVAAATPNEPVLSPAVGEVTIRYHADGSVSTSNVEMRAFQQWQEQTGVVVTTSVGRKRETEADKAHYGRLRQLMERHMAGLARNLGGYELTPPDALGKTWRAEDVAAQWLAAYLSPSPSALGELVARIQSWVQAGSTRR